MGFFSWKTADKNESIYNIYSGCEVKEVYMLQPHDQPPIKEPEYEGCGVFGGVDAYVWLAQANAEHYGFDSNELDSEELRGLGIAIELGDVLQDTQTGDYWHICSDNRMLIPGRYAACNYAEVIPELGDCANNLIQSGRFKQVRIKAIKPALYLLKFSHNPRAIYEDLPPSKQCPKQGFFVKW